MIKQIIPACLVVSLFAGCAQTGSNNEESDQQKKNIELTTQFFEHFNNHDWTQMANMYTEIADFKDPSFGKGVVKQTRSETVAKYSELNEIFPDIHDQVIQMYSSGQKNVIVELVSTGTGPDGSKLELPICIIFTFEDGLITKDFTYYDS